MMSETGNSDATKTDAEKPVSVISIFPPFPAPKDDDFDEDISAEEKKYYLETFPDINKVATMRLHCTACDKHLGSAAKSETRMRSHPMLRTLMCNTCHSFYNSGEFEKGEDGSELYCRWCGQGGQVYCCSDCEVVFCAKCIKRNMGTSKIKEIENIDDWKCFRCNPECLWFLRATCWALLRYCDLKNKIAFSTQDPNQKEAYTKECAQDLTECCKNKIKKRNSENKKKEADKANNKSIPSPAPKKETDANKGAIPSPAAKLPPTIQVKKFASISNEERGKDIKRAQKRPASPKNKFLLKNPITVSPSAKIIPPNVNVQPPPMKKIRMGSPQMLNPIRLQSIQNPRSYTYTRIRPKQSQPPPLVLNNQFNGFNNPSFGNPGMYMNSNSMMYNQDVTINDNINLSLESLCQGLDMNVGPMGVRATNKDDVICTPDFPLEPVCEVTEDNDDDVQCMTPAPAPITYPKPNSTPPLTSKYSMPMDVSSDNIIQMTENDVTVNQATGGLKFRVDPQTLSSNKMYRLPDGRIFAINANPNMPGGYSATIVAVTDNVSGKITPKTGTYAAKLSSVSSPKISSKKVNKQTAQSSKRSSSGNQSSKEKEVESNDSRQCDLKVPVEWYRYNLIDAVDALEYSMSRLQKLKKEATTMFLRTRTELEMRGLHKKLERLLTTSSSRFNEIKTNLNKEMKQYLQKKMSTASNNISDDDDDVEILNDSGDMDDPIFIDENSMDGTSNDANAPDSQEVDLTATSEHNDSRGKPEDHDSGSNKETTTSEHNDSGGKPEDHDSGSNKETTTSEHNDSGGKPEDHDSGSNKEPFTNEKNIKESNLPVIESVKSENVDSIIMSDLETVQKGSSVESTDDTNTEKSSNGDVHNGSKINEDDKVIDDKKDESVKEVNVPDNDNISNDENTNSDSERISEKDNVQEDKNEDDNEDSKKQDVEVDEESRDVDGNGDKNVDAEMGEDKVQDVEMTAELIETLLKDDSVTGDFDNVQNSQTDITEDFRES